MQMYFERKLIGTKTLAAISKKLIAKQQTIA